ncbi:hypothetical protein IC744_10640 [Microbacterium hominis]|uniref:hypothetical protein n=1 Tax=Microbacterium hominis TaxID=162426 RepID=UPI00168AD2D7|nr:hypothetical protein [Microbacterium hominis]QOC27921.1 hypothetical protein IC744_10640 [Microbacterium hominis]
MAAEPPVIGSDGEYRDVQHWDTQYSSPDEPPFAHFGTPTNGVVGADGSLYVMANYSSGSSPLVQRYDPTTGDVLARFGVVEGDPGDEYYSISPTGLWADPDGSIWVIGTNAGSVLAHFSADGVPLSVTSLSTPNSPVGLVRLNDGRFATIMNGFTPSVGTIDGATGTVTEVALPAGVDALSAAGQLNLTPDGALLWVASGTLYTVNPDGSGLTATAAPDVDQATIGADGRLYTVNSSAAIFVTDPSDLSLPGTQIAADRSSPTFASVMPMSTLGVHRRR